jgi:glucosamine 6-phosphate synthetase-like amidotransferase/phosphosugar isomerase protein
MQSITANSFINNCNGEGVYFGDSGTLKTSPIKINFLDYETEILKNKSIISHTRIWTSGKTYDYTQPLLSENFIIVHNGVISKYATTTESDTFNLLQTIESTFKEELIKDAVRENALIKTIKTIFDDLNGSYSILLIDRITKKNYYFKEDVTNITAIKTNDYLFITTARDNSLMLSLLNEQKKYKIHIKDYSIYRIEDNFNLYKIAKIKKPKVYIYVAPQNTREINFNHAIDNNGYTSVYHNSINERKKQTIIEVPSLERCAICYAYSRHKWIEGNIYVCNMCVEEGLLK